MIQKVKNSLAYRMPQVYRRWLSVKPLRKIQSKPTLDKTLVMMTGIAIRDITRLSVYSVAKYWTALPELVIVTDGTIPVDKIKKDLIFWPGSLQVTDWQTIEQHYISINCHAIIDHGNTDVLSRKLAIILYFASIKPTLWLDSDILFYNDFVPYLYQTNNIDSFICGGSEEPHSLYDERVLTHFDIQFPDTYRYSSGLLFISGKNIVRTFNLNNLYQNLKDLYQHYFTEQTIFACLSYKSVGVVWTKELIKNFHTDNQQIKPMSVENVVARHYTKNVRHLIWRDAFFNL